MDRIRGKLILLFVIVSLQGVVQCLQVNFFPFGSAHGDQNLTEGNDETFELELPETISFNFYEQNYSSIHIQTNGVLSLNAAVPLPLRIQRLNEFPLNQNWQGVKQVNALIAPFWADVDTTGGRGVVSFRQSQTGDDVKNATEMVKQYFPRQPTFNASWVMVVTWKNVSYSGRDNTSTTDNRNTFQTVLTTDGESSFAFFIYDEIKWTAGTTMGGDPELGRPLQPEQQAIVGFNKGDGNTSFTDGFPEQRKKLPLTTNLGRKLGLFAFQVDMEDIKPAGCSNEESDIVTYPSYGSSDGGERIYLYGPCWNKSSSLLCEFWTVGSSPRLLQNVSGTIQNTTSAYCLPGNFSEDGELEIKISINGGDTFQFFGEYSIISETTTPVQTTSLPSDGGMEGWLIAIIVIACLAAVFLCSFLVGLLVQRRKARRGTRLPQEDKDTSEL